MRLRVLATLVAAAVAAAPAAAQSLAEAAAREKARREKETAKRPAAKIITEDELRGRRTGGTLSQPAADAGSSAPAPAAPGAAGTPAAAAPAVGAAAAPAERQKTDDELREEKQTEWRQKVHDAQANVANLRAKQDEIQGALNDTRTVYGPGRAGLMNQLEKTKAALAEAEQALSNLQEEGRRSRYR